MGISEREANDGQAWADQSPDFLRILGSGILGRMEGKVRSFRD